MIWIDQFSQKEKLFANSGKKEPTTKTFRKLRTADRKLIRAKNLLHRANRDRYENNDKWILLSLFFCLQELLLLIFGVPSNHCQNKKNDIKIFKAKNLPHRVNRDTYDI